MKTVLALLLALTAAACSGPYGRIDRDPSGLNPPPGGWSRPSSGPGAPP